jgi:thiamine pyrophosphate-dependent acetolactate synthase large subunit-like protein
MGKSVADGTWEMLVSAGVRRCYGIVGDALNPVIDALRRNGSVDFVHVRNEEYGAFTAVTEARLTGKPAAVCGTAGPGVTYLINGLLDARKERLSLPAHTPLATVKGFTLSLAKQVVSGDMDDVIETAEHNVRLL